MKTRLLSKKLDKLLQAGCLAGNYRQTFAEVPLSMLSSIAASSGDSLGAVLAVCSASESASLPMRRSQWTWQLYILV